MIAQSEAIETLIQQAAAVGLDLKLAIEIEVAK